MATPTLRALKPIKTKTRKFSTGALLCVDDLADGLPLADYLRIGAVERLPDLAPI